MVTPTRTNRPKTRNIGRKIRLTNIIINNYLQKPSYVACKFPLFSFVWQAKTHATPKTPYATPST